MGAKTWMLVYAETDARAALKAKPMLDREATARMAARLFPGEALQPLEDGSLGWTNPPDDELVIGCFSGVTVIAAREFGLDRPSTLPRSFIDAGGRGSIQLYGMHSVVDWFAHAAWSNGQLVRSVSLSPDSGIMEDIGARLPVEAPYWAGEHSADDEEDPEDPYPLPFHPLEFGEAILEATLGFQYEGYLQPDTLEPEHIVLARYRRTKAGWTHRLPSAFGRSAR